MTVFPLMGPLFNFQLSLQDLNILPKKKYTIPFLFIVYSLGLTYVR